MAQYPIPQFIEAEGKIISFMTFRQFFIVVGGGGICFLLYFILPFTFFLVAAVPVALITGAVGFLKIDDVPVTTTVLNFVKYTTRSKNYVWKKKEYPYPFKISMDNRDENAHRPNALQTKAEVLNDTKKMVELRKK